MSTRTLEGVKVHRRVRRPADGVPRVDARGLAEGMKGATENQTTVVTGPPYRMVLACGYDDSRPSLKRD